MGIADLEEQIYGERHQRVLLQQAGLVQIVSSNHFVDADDTNIKPERCIAEIGLL